MATAPAGDPLDCGIDHCVQAIVAVPRKTSARATARENSGHVDGMPISARRR